MTKCTARRSWARLLRAYLTAPIVARSTSSTSTTVLCRLKFLTAPPDAPLLALTADRASASARYCRLSRISANTPIGKISTTSQAPSVNLTTAKMMTTSSETVPESRLTATFARHDPSRRWLKYLAIPKPAKLNPVKTPMA